MGTAAAAEPWVSLPGRAAAQECHCGAASGSARAKEGNSVSGYIHLLREQHQG